MHIDRQKAKDAKSNIEAKIIETIWGTHLMRLS